MITIRRRSFTGQSHRSESTVVRPHGRVVSESGLSKREHVAAILFTASEHVKYKCATRVISGLHIKVLSRVAD